MTAGVDRRPIVERDPGFATRHRNVPPTWPDVEFSRIVNVRGRAWHVQRIGRGPQLLMLHGTGASTHSWRGLTPLLSRHFELFSVDLPGHGFTERRPGERLSLETMASEIGRLLEAERCRPEFAVGHSAGAAIVFHMQLEGIIAPQAAAGLNPALLPFGGSWQPLISPLARWCAGSRLLPKLVAARARDRDAVRRMIASTGSRLDDRGLELYRQLMSSEAHVGAVLSMMGNWDLKSLCRRLPAVESPVTLIAGERDLAVRAEHMRSVRDVWPAAACIELAGAGHLAHEERPGEVAGLLNKAFGLG